MGGGIALVASQSGYEVVLKDEGRIRKRQCDLQKIKERLGKRVGEGKT